MRDARNNRQDHRGATRRNKKKISVTDRLARNIRTLRRNKEMSQKTLGEKVFLARKAIWQAEKTGRLNVAHLENFADALGVDNPADLISKDFVLKQQ